MRCRHCRGDMDAREVLRKNYPFGRKSNTRVTVKYVKHRCLNEECPFYLGRKRSGFTSRLRFEVRVK